MAQPVGIAKGCCLVRVQLWSSSWWVGHSPVTMARSTLGLCIIGANLTSIPATTTFLLIVVMVWGTIETSWCQIARPLTRPGCYLIFIMVPLLWTLICKKKTKTLSFCRGHFHTSVSLLPIPLCSGTLCFFLSSSLGKKKHSTHQVHYSFDLQLAQRGWVSFCREETQAYVG